MELDFHEALRILHERDESAYVPGLYRIAKYLPFVIAFYRTVDAGVISKEQIMIYLASSGMRSLHDLLNTSPDISISMCPNVR